MTKMLRVLATLLVIFSLMGCGTKKTEVIKDNAVGTTPETVVEDKTTTDTTTTDTTTEAKLPTGNNHKLAVADDVADKIVKMKEVESANVIVTDTTAYVAVVLKKGTEGTKQIEDKIADEARAANANFKNVYVSLNPEFVTQMSEYGTKIRANEPVAGFFEEFSASMKKVFPEAH